MLQNIINSENKQIEELINDYNFNLNYLKTKKELINKKSNFTDSLNNSFYMGRVGFMSKKDNARKSKELDKFIESCKTETKIEQEINLIEKRIKSLSTGNYLIRKNGVRVETYKLLNEKLTALEIIKTTGIIKGKQVTQEEMQIVKTLINETKKAIKKREKNFK